LFSSASASITESVTMTSSEAISLSSASWPRAGAPGPQVAADTIPERPGLSDVDRLPAGISPQVDAGLFRQTRDLVSEILDGHGLDGLV
jgi:hypothetical protein